MPQHQRNQRDSLHGHGALDVSVDGAVFWGAGRSVRDYDGNEFLENGGFWMQKQHIFLYPFYYVDYAMAQIGAFEFYTKMKENRPAAWEDYYNLCKAGGSKGYFELLAEAKLHNVLEEGAVREALAGVLAELGV